MDSRFGRSDPDRIKAELQGLLFDPRNYGWHRSSILQ
jgi:hypothetical protein